MIFTLVRLRILVEENAKTLWQYKEVYLQQSEIKRYIDY